MPFQSKSQARAMFAAASGHSTLGIPASVGQKFVADAAPGSIKKLPKLVGTAHKVRSPPKIKSAGHMVFGSLAPIVDEDGNA